MNQIHEVKCLREFFVPIIEGRKTFEVRKNDRNYKVGDGLLLIEIYKNGRSSGRAAYCHISYILPGGSYGISPEYCVLGIQFWQINHMNVTYPESESD